MHASRRTLRHAFVQGASRGIGLGFVAHLLAHGAPLVVASARDPSGSAGLADLSAKYGSRLRLVQLDVSEEASIEAAAQLVETWAGGRLDLVLNVSGLLHAQGMRPEKSLRDLDVGALERSFAVNAFGPAMMAKHFHGLLRHGERAVWVNMSARLGSIGDNHRGGWYAYRASKAAQNMFTRTFAIEMRRLAPEAIVVALHPGTVDTGLSKPFQRSVPPGKLFGIDRAVRQLMTVIDGLELDDHGGFFAWDGSPIPW